MSTLSKNLERELIKKSYSSRIKILEMMKNGKSHIGGAFSCIDIITVLYNCILKNKPEEPDWEKRDRFILSAGHKAIALYCVLADRGYFTKKILETYNRFNSKIPEHPEKKLLSGIEFPTGSLGHGFPVGNGMALAAKLDKKSHKVFILISDGECTEGSIWEAEMTASHYKLDNVIVIIDRNGLQVNGKTSEILDSSPLEEKFKSFGWETSCINGHNFKEIYSALKGVPFREGKPSCIVADTIKAKGLPFAESDFNFHNWSASKQELTESIVIVKEEMEKELIKVEQNR